MDFNDLDYEQMAIKSIIDYKNKDYTDDEVKKLYPLAISLIVENIKKSLIMDKSISQITEGNKSTTYKDNSIIDDIVKKILGNPYLRCF